MSLMLSLPKIHPDVAEYLSPEEFAVVNAAAKPRELSALQATNLLSEANLSPDKVLVIAGLLNTAAVHGGTCVSIKFQAIPYSISSICTGFVLIWLLFLPLGLFRGVAVGPEITYLDATCQYVIMIIAFLFLSLLLLACDEISNQLEDPFYQLPLHEIIKSSSAKMQKTVENLISLRTASAQGAARSEKEAANGTKID
jgi:predicted membrane chloride channel (bestrophin family)